MVSNGESTTFECARTAFQAYIFAILCSVISDEANQPLDSPENGISRIAKGGLNDHFYREMRRNELA
jgi:hypothetical protein